MPKTFVIDTNVLLHDPDALFAFDDNKIVISLAVINELDRKKNEPGLIGKNARQVARTLLELSLKADQEDNDESLIWGITINNSGGVICVDECYLDLKGLTVDDYLIALASNRDAILVTKDNYMRVKAQIFGTANATYEHDRVVEEYTGHIEALAPADLIDDLYGHQRGGYDQNYSLLEVFDSTSNLYPNQCLTLISDSDPKQTALCIIDKKVKNLSLISTFKDMRVAGIKPLNAEQRYAMHLLLDPSIKLVTINGSTGSGKTMMSLASGIHQVGAPYENVIVTRQEVAVGGERQPWLPGDLQEKQDPWLKGVYHNLTRIAKHHQPNLDKGFGYNKPYDYYLTTGIVVPESLPYVRGTTYDSYIVMTEAQNCHPSILKTLVTRAGSDAKVVLEGDVKQIDCVSPRFLDEHTNGLTVTVDKWKGSEIYGHISLMKNVRSELSMEAERRYNS